MSQTNTFALISIQINAQNISLNNVHCLQEDKVMNYNKSLQRNY